MTHIVERLCALAAIDNCQASLEAADAITRLRAENERLTRQFAEHADRTADDIAALRAGIAAWPGMFYHPARPDEEACIFLPLPQEARDE